MVFVGNVNHVFGGWLVLWFMERRRMVLEESYKKDDADGTGEGDIKS
jgi:hypothetical protein